MVFVVGRSADMLVSIEAATHLPHRIRIIPGCEADTTLHPPVTHYRPRCDRAGIVMSCSQQKIVTDQHPRGDERQVPYEAANPHCCRSADAFVRRPHGTGHFDELSKGRN